MLKRPKNPCSKQCNDRSAKCHENCKKYREYERLYIDFIAEKVQTMSVPEEPFKRVSYIEKGRKKND